jgi:hypothetical protein
MFSRLAARESKAIKNQFPASSVDRERYEEKVLEFSSKENGHETKANGLFSRSMGGIEPLVS